MDSKSEYTNYLDHFSSVFGTIAVLSSIYWHQSNYQYGSHMISKYFSVIWKS